jgi:hypothetical protein
MDYNTSRSKLVISEYGRNVQKMVEYAIALEDREQRSRLATLIVNVMAQLNPSIRELHDYKQKLWDHLHIISDFRLDVDSPYPVPDRETLENRPGRLAYHSNGIKVRHYGKHIENIIQNVIELEDGPKKDEYIRLIANQLKKSYLTYNRESVTDEVIAAHLADLSEGKLILGEDVELARTHDILQKQGVAANGARQKKQSHRPGQAGYKQHGYQQQSSYYKNKRNKRSQ